MMRKEYLFQIFFGSGGLGITFVQSLFSNFREVGRQNIEF